MSASKWMSASEALATLGVRPQTLYAYVSRGLVDTCAHPDDARRSLYDSAKVRELARRNKRSRKRADIATEAIAWGEPVLPSAITTVESGHLYYRGRDAVELSDTWSLEATARLLLATDVVSAPRGDRALLKVDGDLRRRLFLTLADRAASASSLLGCSAEKASAEAATLLDLVADAVSGDCLALHIHARLAIGWGLDPAGPAADMIRRMLVLLADHELNASTFATRVAASTGASLAASLLAGLAALSGPRHGSAHIAVRRFGKETELYGAVEAIQNRLAESRHIPGFGHVLYPAGDVRASALLSHFDVPEPFAALREQAKAYAGVEPNIDFVLVTACQTFGLPDDAPFAIFATARAAGWIAHAVEQSRSSHLIRPRARYVGIVPSAIG